MIKKREKITIWSKFEYTEKKVVLYLKQGQKNLSQGFKILSFLERYSKIRF